MPLTSNLNASTANETIANLVIVPVGAGGTVKLFTQSGTHLIADVAGWFGAEASVTTGLFVPVTRIASWTPGSGSGLRPRSSDRVARVT